jgi:hypothetical protein
MQQLTVGIEIEARARPIKVCDPDVRMEPTAVQFADGMPHPELNRKIVMANDFTWVTLEVNQDSRLATSAKLELITPTPCTASADLFTKSTADMLFVLHHLYFFLDLPCRSNNTVVLDEQPYDRNAGGFTTWYEHHLVHERVSPEDHPKLSYRRIRGLNSHLKFPVNLEGAAVTPRFAPQLTFSGPMERVPALFFADPNTFSQPPVHSGSKFYTPSMLERRAAEVGIKFVNERIVPIHKDTKSDDTSRRSAQKLHGFFALVAYHVLGYFWEDYINLEDARTVHGLSKESFRFLLKASLQELHQNGLSITDQFAIKRAFQNTADLVRELQSACVQSVTTDPAYTLLSWEARLRTAYILGENKVARFLEAIFKKGADYPAALAKLVDTYTLIRQRETDVLRKDNVKLQRPVMEYRRLTGNHDKYFASAAETADAIETLFNQLRFLESDVNPTKASIEATASSAYYQPLKNLSPSDVAEVNGLPKLSIPRPQGNDDVESWWARLAARVASASAG